MLSNKSVSSPQDKKRSWRYKPHPSYFLFAAPLLSACGGDSPVGISTPEADNTTAGLPSSYTPPASAYRAPTTADPNAFALQTDKIDPYWVKALASSRFDELGTFYQSHDNVIQFAFPEVMPSYFTGMDSIGWQAASPAVQAAFLEIFNNLEDVFNVTFTETSSLETFNTIVVSQNDQFETAGYAYFPETADYIGSDIFLSTVYNAPAVTGTTSNFDYELLLHELAHALGLKHPFEADGTATELLSAAEDNSNWTVTTYTQVEAAYDGAYRDLDLMAFARLFGVKPTHKPGDDTYSFSSASGVFILDGAGTDTISAESQSSAALIDLRVEMQSHLGGASNLITAPNQLTISAGSDIENAIGGAGNDYLIGNAGDNTLIGGAGHDRIFASDGSDTVQGGPGNDEIDLSELSAHRDVLRFESTASNNGTDTVFSFQQGASGDVVDLSLTSDQPLQSVVAAALVPVVTVSNVILRLVDDALDTASGLLSALSAGGALSDLQIASNSTVYVLSASTQATGEDQQLFHVANSGSSLAIAHLATFSGNALDIDSWHNNNFI